MPTELTEQVAYWFFRLNGCFTFVNFVVHPDGGGSQRTDADLIAVRFPHRQELLTGGNSMQDHPLLAAKGIIQVFFVEVKTADCRLNGPWTDSQKANLHRVLHAIGVLPTSEVDNAATELYASCKHDTPTMAIRFVAIGSQQSQLPPAQQNVTQLTWDQVLLFIYERMTLYCREKADHPQWDDVGKLLYQTAVERLPHQSDIFVYRWFGKMNLPPPVHEAIYEELKRVARAQTITRYAQISPLAQLNMSRADHRASMSEILDKISSYEYAQGRPMLSGVVVHSDGEGGGSLPGTGFFTLAKRLGLQDNLDNVTFFSRELARIHEAWHRGSGRR